MIVLSDLILSYSEDHPANATQMKTLGVLDGLPLFLAHLAEQKNVSVGPVDRNIACMYPQQTHLARVMPPA